MPLRRTRPTTISFIPHNTAKHKLIACTMRTNGPATLREFHHVDRLRFGDDIRSTDLVLGVVGMRSQGRFQLSFGLAGLAAPQGVLGPVGTNRGAEQSAPLLSPLSLPRLSERGTRTMPGPKTQSCPRAERTHIVLWEGAPRRAVCLSTFENQEGGPCNTPLYIYSGVMERSHHV